MKDARILALLPLLTAALASSSFAQLCETSADDCAHITSYQGSLTPGSTYCAKNSVSGTVPYTAKFWGEYTDFTTGSGSVEWFSEPTSTITASTTGSCYLAMSCPLAVCTSSSSSTAAPDYSFKTGTGVNGQITSVTAIVQPGVSACHTVSITVLGVRVPEILCVGAYGPATDVGEMTAPSHCADVITIYPPTIACDCGSPYCPGAGQDYQCVEAPDCGEDEAVCDDGEWECVSGGGGCDNNDDPCCDDEDCCDDGDRCIA
jgi:hypothetical protein